MDGKTDPLLDAFARALRARRRALGLTEEELAHRAGLSMRYVSLLESRRHQPTLATLRALGVGLGMTMTELIAATEAETEAG